MNKIPSNIETIGGLHVVFGMHFSLKYNTIK